MAGFGELEDIAERFDAMTESFTDVARAVDTQDAHTGVSVPDLFTDPFMQAHTEYPTIEAFVRHSPLDSSPSHDDARVSREAIEAYIARSSEFDSWENMVEAAKVAWLEREMGLL